MKKSQTKEIQSLLLWHYLFAVEAVKECKDFKDAQILAQELNVEIGVCYCAKRSFGFMIYDARWVTKNCNGIFWASPVYAATSIPEIINRLQIRIDILQKELAA